MRTWVLIAMLAMAPAVANADSSHSTSGDTNVTANGGQGGDGGNAVAFGGQGGAGGKSESSSVANGGKADAKASADSVNVNSQKTDVDASSRNTNKNSAKSDQKQFQGQGQSTSIDFGSTKVEVAAPAGDVHGMTTGSDATICGVVGGASAQSGLVGAGVSSESFACLAHKHSLYQAEAHSDADRSIENFSWYFPPFMVVRLVRSAIFN